MPDDGLSCSLDASAGYATAQEAPEPAAPRTSEQVVRAPAVGIPIGPTAEHCASKLDGLAIALLTTGSVASVLGALKAGLDFAECASSERNAAQTAANHRAAIDACVAHEGTPLGFLDDTLTCAVPPGKTP